MTKPQIFILSILLCACAANKTNTTTGKAVVKPDKKQEEPQEISISEDSEVVEEVAIRKEETERTEKVRDTVRREEVEVTDNNGRQASP